MLPEQSSNLCFVARVFQTLRAGLLLTRVWSLSMLLVTLEMLGTSLQIILPKRKRRRDISSVDSKLILDVGHLSYLFCGWSLTEMLACRHWLAQALTLLHPTCHQLRVLVLINHSCRLSNMPPWPSAWPPSTLVLCLLVQKVMLDSFNFWESKCSFSSWMSLAYKKPEVQLAWALLTTCLDLLEELTMANTALKFGTK